jgi:hypothetical protein
LEQSILEELSGRPSVSNGFSRFAIERFRWDEGLGHLPDYHRGVARELLSIPEADEHLEELKQQAKRWLWKIARDFGREPLAAALLLSGYRPLWFRLASFDLANIRAVERLFGELESFYPGLVERHLDAATVAWWRRELERPRGRGYTLLRLFLSVFSVPLLGGLFAFVALLMRPDPPTWQIALLISALVVVAAALPLGAIIFKENITKFVLWALDRSARATVTLLVILAALFVWYLFEDPPWSYVVTGTAFLALIAASGREDSGPFFLSCMALWGLLALAALLWPKLTTVIAPDIYFWAVQFAVFAVIKSRRMIKRQRTA